MNLNEIKGNIQREENKRIKQKRNYQGSFKIINDFKGKSNVYLYEQHFLFYLQIVLHYRY